MVPFLKSKRSGGKSMSRIFLVFAILIHGGCAALKTSVAEYSSFSVDTEYSVDTNCAPVQVHLALSVDESRILRCEHEGRGVEIDGLFVRLFAMEDGEHWISDDGKFNLEDDVHGALYNPATGRLWTSRVCLSKFPHYATSYYEGGVGGGHTMTELCFDPQVQLPNDVCDYPCIGCEIWLRVCGEVKRFDAYLFRRGIDMKEIRSLRRLYLTQDDLGCGWQFL